MRLKDTLYFFCASCRPNTSKTVRYAFPAIIASLVLVSIAATLSPDQNTSYISISASPDTVASGETFTVIVSAVAHTAVNAVDIELTFPETQAEILGIDTGNSVITLWTEEPYAEDGIVHLRGGTFRRGFIGEHEIARIRARATESGSAVVSVDGGQFIAGDGSGTIVNLSENDEQEARIYITNEDGSLVGEVTVQIVTDIDGDGAVSMADIQAFMAAWNNKSKVYDFNNDGKMSFRDFAILLADSFFK